MIEESSDAHSATRDAGSGFGVGIAAAIQRTDIAAILLFTALINVGFVFNGAVGHPERIDFSVYYVSSLAMRQGLNPYTADLEPLSKTLGLQLGALTHANHTPTFLLCFEPLTLMTPTGAYWAWFGLTVAMLAALLFLLIIESQDLPRASRYSMVAIVGLYSPVMQNFIWSQCDILLLFLFVIALRMMQRRRDVAAGIAIAAAGLLKAFPLLLLVYFIWRRRWLSLYSSLGALAAGSAITIAFVGLERFLSFAVGTKWVLSIAASARANDVAVGASAARLASYVLGKNLGTAFGTPGWIVSISAVLTVLAFSTRATLNLPEQVDDHFRAYSLWIATSIFVAPLAWPHYMALLVLPFIRGGIPWSRERARMLDGCAQLCAFRNCAGNVEQTEAAGTGGFRA